MGIIKMDDDISILDRPTMISAPTSTGVASPVNSWNEWDPLAEVIVGRLDGAVVPPFHVSVTNNRRYSASWLHRLIAGHRYPQWVVRRARSELDGFIRLLESEGVHVRRPEIIDQRRWVRTRLWSSRGFCLACPRDVYLVVGNEIIETPTCWRSRHFEGDAYRALFKEYFAAGARWTAAPRPQLPDELFDANYRIPQQGEQIRYITNELEPVFDAADVAPGTGSASATGAAPGGATNHVTVLRLGASRSHGNGAAVSWSVPARDRDGTVRSTTSDGLRRCTVCEGCPASW